LFAHEADLSEWHKLQAFGDPNSMVAAGAGGLKEWSLRSILAKEVFGI
jgi:hypothetical protein